MAHEPPLRLSRLSRSIRMLMPLAVASLGCRDERVPEIILNNEGPTLALLAWDLDDPPDDLYVEFGPDTSYGRVANGNADPDGVYKVALRGMKPSATCHWRSNLVLDGESSQIEGEFTTNPLPTDIPTLTRGATDLASQIDGYMVTTFGASEFSPVILDKDGDVVWWTPERESIRGITTRTRISRDSLSILFDEYIFLADSKDEDPRPQDSDLVEAGWDGNVNRRVLTPDGHHDFVELPDGTFAYIVGEMRDVEGVSIRGDGIVELARDGSTRSVWSSWDHVASDDNPQGYDPLDMPEGNTLAYDESQDVYHLGLRDYDSIVRISRASGEMEWSIGGVGSSFELVGDGTPFSQQHNFEFTDDGILIFDNGSVKQLSSRAVEYRLDLDAMTMEQIWSYVPNPPLYTFAMGDVHRLPGGNTLVIWGTQGQIDEVNPAGESVTRFNLSLGTGATYVSYAESLDEQR